MNNFGLSFHHFGLAVRTPDDAFTYLRALGYEANGCAFDPLQRVNLALFSHAQMPDVEVIWPGNGPSPIDNLVKRGGSLIYHLCYVTQDAERSLAAMEAAGLAVVPLSDSQPAVLFGGSKVSFYSVGNVGIIELIHGQPGSR